MRSDRRYVRTLECHSCSPARLRPKYFLFIRTHPTPPFNHSPTPPTLSSPRDTRSCPTGVPPAGYRQSSSLNEAAPGRLRAIALLALSASSLRRGCALLALPEPLDSCRRKPGTAGSRTAQRLARAGRERSGSWRSRCGRQRQQWARRRCEQALVSVDCKAERSCACIMRGRVRCPCPCALESSRISMVTRTRWGRQGSRAGRRGQMDDCQARRR